jgi:hypothetical protein
MREAPLVVRVTPGGEGFHFDAQQKRILKTWANQWVLIRRPRRTRTLDQNSYLHAEVFPKIAAYMGDDIEGAKLVLMGECFGWKQDARFGREIPVKPHTSSMTVEECTYFIEWVIPWAVERCEGLQILLPGEWARTREDDGA